MWIMQNLKLPVGLTLYFYWAAHCRWRSWIALNPGLLAELGTRWGSTQSFVEGKDNAPINKELWYRCTPAAVCTQEGYSDPWAGHEMQADPKEGMMAEPTLDGWIHQEPKRKRGEKNRNILPCSCFFANSPALVTVLAAGHLQPLLLETMTQTEGAQGGTGWGWAQAPPTSRERKLPTEGIRDCSICPSFKKIFLIEV